MGNVDKTEQTTVQSSDYAEIDLNNILKILIKWKYIIIGITLASIILTGIVNKLYVKQVYEGTAIIAFADIKQLTQDNTTYVLNSNIGNRFDIDELVKLAQIDAKLFNQLVTSDIVLQRTINELGLQDNSNTLKQKVSVVDNTNKGGVINISVKAETPDLVANIASIIVEQTTLLLCEINNRKIDGLRSTLEVQLNTYQEKLSKEYEMQVSAVDMEKNQLNNDTKRNEYIIDSINEKILELDMYKSLNSAENQVIIISSAESSVHGVSSNKILALAGVLGLMISVMVVYVVQSLRKE